jgi:3-dehydroquinate synthase class II
VSTEKSLWFCVGADTDAKVLEAASYRAFDAVWLEATDTTALDRAPLPRGMRVVLQVSNSQQLRTALADASWSDQIGTVLCSDPAVLGDLRAVTNGRDLAVGVVHAVTNEQTLHEACDLTASVDVLVLDFADPTNIPLELVLATTQGTPCRVIKRVTTAEDGISSAMTMESGADGIALRSNDLTQVVALDEAFTEQKVEQLRLVSARVSSIRQAGMGDRICIDTTSAMESNEGMLLGSTSAGGLLLASETHFLPYMELRPFRVNAGGLHHYVWAPNNRTFYLSELRAGMEVLVVSDTGRARTVTIGRLKIERRPLLLIEAEAEGERLNVFIQDDWHVRLIGEGGAIRPSAEIEIGDALLAYRDKPGRHVGIAIDETIREV